MQTADGRKHSARRRILDGHFRKLECYGISTTLGADADLELESQVGQSLLDHFLGRFESDQKSKQIIGQRVRLHQRLTFAMPRECPS
jgi:hypothetical protein